VHAPRDAISSWPPPAIASGASSPSSEPISRHNSLRRPDPISPVRSPERPDNRVPYHSNQPRTFGPHNNQYITNFGTFGSESTISIGKGYSIFNPDIASLANTSFSPFGDSDFVVKPRTQVDRRSAALLGGTSGFGQDTQPSGGNIKDDSVWQILGNGKIQPVTDHAGYDAYEPTTLTLATGQTSQTGEFNQPVQLRSPAHLAQDIIVSAPRSAFPTSILRPGLTATVKEMTGLNPDAKVFSPPRLLTGNHSPLSAGPPILTSPTLTLASYAPDESHTSPTNTTFFSSLRAFAPSPAEREALSRALAVGNTSLEKLTTSDSSPSPTLRQTLPTSPSGGMLLPRSPFLPPSATDYGSKWSGATAAVPSGESPISLSVPVNTFGSHPVSAPASQHSFFPRQSATSSKQRLSPERESDNADGGKH